MRASILLVLFACVALSTAADYCINNPGSCVRVRQSAGTSAPILACAPHNARLATDGQVRMADGMNWRRVQYNGAWGWAAVQYLTTCSGGSTGGGTTTTGCNFGATTSVVAYSRGQIIGNIEVVTLQGKPVEKRTACAFTQMAASARTAGLNLKINSGFRSMEEQQYLYNCYRTGSCNNGNKAAKPGYSNHQNGIALDISTGGGAYEWLAANAHKFGFVRTVPTEKWHWEYRPGQPRASYT